jgi:AcrR family transcriptional regulator
VVDLPKENPSLKSKVVRKKRPRRSTELVLDLLIEAARQEFEEKGFEGTSTAAIARRAGVTEALIFSKFGTKSRLFHDSIFKPLDQHIVQFSAAHLGALGDPEEFTKDTRIYIRELQQFIRRHSRMLSSLVVAQMYASDSVKSLSQVEGLHNYFARGTSMAMRHLAENKPKIHPKLLVRVSFATLLASIIFHDWLFPPGLASEAQISAAIIDFVMEGLSANEVSVREPKRPVRGRARSATKR